MKRTTSYHKMMESSNEDKYENNVIGAQMIMEAYVEAIQEIKDLKISLKDITQSKETQISNLTEKISEVNV
jgi:hypothetical protein